MQYIFNFWLCVCVWMCAHEYKCPWRPEELMSQVGMSYSTWLLRTDLECLARAVCTVKTSETCLQPGVISSWNHFITNIGAVKKQWWHGYSMIVKYERLSLRRTCSGPGKVVKGHEQSIFSLIKRFQFCAFLSMHFKISRYHVYADEKRALTVAK